MRHVLRLPLAGGGWREVAYDGRAVAAPSDRSWNALSKWVMARLVRRDPLASSSDWEHLLWFCTSTCDLGEEIRSWARGIVWDGMATGLVRPEDMAFAGECFSYLGTCEYACFAQAYLEPLQTETCPDKLFKLILGAVYVLCGNAPSRLEALARREVGIPEPSAAEECALEEQAKAFLLVAQQRYAVLGFKAQLTLLMWVFFGEPHYRRNPFDHARTGFALTEYATGKDRLPAGMYDEGAEQERSMLPFAKCNPSGLKRARSRIFEWAFSEYLKLLMADPGSIAVKDYANLYCAKWVNNKNAPRARHHPRLCAVSLDWLLAFHRHVNRWIDHLDGNAAAKKFKEFLATELYTTSWMKGMEWQVQPAAERAWPELAKAVARPSCASTTFTSSTTAKSFTISHPVYPSVTARITGSRWRISCPSNPENKPRYAHPLGAWALMNAMAEVVAKSWKVGDLPKIEGLRRIQTIGLAKYGRMRDALTSRTSYESAKWIARELDYVRAGIGRTVASCSQIVSAGFPQVHLRVYKLFFAMRPWKDGPPELFQLPALWRNQHLVHDLLKYPAARVALWILAEKHRERNGLSVADKAALERVLSGNQSWMDVLTPTWREPGSAYRALRRMAMCLPPGARVPELRFLTEIRIPAPVESVLHLRLLSIYAERRRYRLTEEEFWAIQRVTADEVADALGVLFTDRRSWVLGGVRNKAGTRTWSIRQVMQCQKRMHSAFADLFDYERPFRGGLRAYTRDSIAWHVGQGRVRRLLGSSNGLTTTTALPSPTSFALDVEGCTEAEVTRIATVGDLIEEGNRMHHCVASYAHAAHAGDAFIYHVSLPGKGEATVEIDADGRVRQVRSECNAVDTPAVAWAARNLPKLIRRVS